MVGRDEKLCWELCELAAIEQDPEKVLAIAREIRQLLDESERLIKETVPRRLEAKPHSFRILDHSSTLSEYEIESLAGEATLTAEKITAEKKRRRQKQRNLPKVA
jgi:CelD/BcsL family acetyltransferase involved in cellulose biosynthesis